MKSVTAKQLEEITTSQDELVEKHGSLKTKLEIINDDLDKKIVELEKLLREYDLTKDQVKQMNQMQKDINGLRNDYDEIFALETELAKYLHDILNQMKLDSEPNKEADYWDEKDKINKDIDNLAILEAKMGLINKTFESKVAEFNANHKRFMELDNDTEAKSKEIIKQQSVREEILAGYRDQEKVASRLEEIHTGLEDCIIPVNL